MTLLNICLVSLFSLASMFVSVKIIGNRQMSELNMFDYINGITIGSIAAEMATSLEGDFLKPLTAMAVYTAAVYLISVVNSKSLRARRIIGGRSLALIYNGKFLPENFKKTKVDLSEFLNQCRVQGFFDVNDIAYAFLEENGKISVLPKESSRPLTVGDIKGGITETEASPNISLILDGHLLTENLRLTGRDYAWLTHMLAEQKISSVSDVFYASVNASGTFTVFRKKRAEHSGNDIFK